MLIARSPARLSLLLVLAGSPVAVVACAYDWTVATGAPLDDGGQDATIDDATTDALPSSDASAPPDGDAHANALSPDASAPSCKERGAVLMSASLAAKACMNAASG